MTWSTCRRAGLRLALVSAAIAACARADGATFWQNGQTYELAMHVATRSPSLQAKRDSGTLKDTVFASLEVDSVAGDSIFGSYSADWRVLGVWLGAMPPSPQRFAGRVSGSEFGFNLAPHVVDAGAGFHGLVRGSEAHGSWGVDGGAVSGEFQLTRNRSSSANR